MIATEKSKEPIETLSSSSSVAASHRQTAGNINTSTNKKISSIGGDSFEQQFLTMEGTQQPKQTLLL